MFDLENESQGAIPWRISTSIKVTPEHFSPALTVFEKFVTLEMSVKVMIYKTVDLSVEAPAFIVIDRSCLEDCGFDSHCRSGSFLRFNSRPVMYGAVVSLASSGVLGPSTSLEPLDLIVQ